MSAFEWINRQSYIERGITGKGAVVAVIDSGFDLSHSEFSNGNVIGTRSFSYMDRDDPDSVPETSGHGTSVASIVAGRTCGIAPDAKLLLLKVAIDNSGANGAGSIAEAVRYATDWRGPSGDRVSIINISSGGQNRLVAMREAIQRAVANDILVVCAAGNKGDRDPETDEIAYPAGWPEPVAVAAHSSTLQVASYSNSNDEIDLIAPGLVNAAMAGGNGYRSFTGTSAAAPCVSAVAALNYEDLYQRLGRRPSEPEMFEELLYNTTLDGLSSTDPREVGAGRLFLNAEVRDLYPFEGYRITSPFGPRKHPVTGQHHFHTGIDLVKYHRAPIPAFVGGQVVYAGEGRSGSGFGGFGIVVAVRDRNDCLHCYVHLDSVSVSVGDEVEKGQEIGKQGNTGVYTTGSHLHYEIRKRYSPANGWVGREEDRCHGPTEYLIKYYEEDEEMYQELVSIINEQRDTIAQLERRVKSLEKEHEMDVPGWAKESIDAAVARGLIDTPEGGSRDFYRFVTIMQRAGVIGKNDGSIKGMFPNHFS